MRKDAMTITRPGHVAKGDDGRVSLADHFPKTASSSFLLSPHFRVLLLDESGRLQWFRSSDSQCDVMRWSVSRAKPQACKRRIGRSLPWASSRRLRLGVRTIRVAIARKVGESILASAAIEGKRDDFPEQ